MGKPKTVGERIRSSRVANDMTQTSLARLSGVSQARISYYEADKAMPTNTTLERLAKPLNTTLGDLLGIR